MLVSKKVEAESVFLAGLKSMAEWGERYFNNTDELVLPSLYLIPYLKSKNESFKNFDICSWHHHWKLGSMTEIRGIIMQLYRSLKSLAGWVIRWERLIPYKHTAISPFHFVLFWHILIYLWDILSLSVYTYATLTNLSYVKVELGKNWIFFHLVDCLLPSFKFSYFLFMLLKLLLVLEFYMIISVRFFFLVSLLEIDFNIQRASKLKLLFGFFELFYLRNLLFFLIFLLRIDFILSSSLTF